MNRDEATKALVSFRRTVKAVVVQNNLYMEMME